MLCSACHKPFHFSPLGTSIQSAFPMKWFIIMQTVEARLEVAFLLRKPEGGSSFSGGSVKKGGAEHGCCLPLNTCWGLSNFLAAWTSRHLLQVTRKGRCPKATSSSPSPFKMKWAPNIYLQGCPTQMTHCVCTTKSVESNPRMPAQKQVPL